MGGFFFFFCVDSFLCLFSFLMTIDDFLKACISDWVVSLVLFSKSIKLLHWVVTLYLLANELNSISSLVFLLKEKK